MRYIIPLIGFIFAHHAAHAEERAFPHKCDDGRQFLIWTTGSGFNTKSQLRFNGSSSVETLNQAPDDGRSSENSRYRVRIEHDGMTLSDIRQGQLIKKTHCIELPGVPRPHL